MIVFDFIYFRKVFFIAFWYGLGRREICRAFYFPPGTAHCPSLVCWGPRAFWGGVRSTHDRRASTRRGALACSFHHRTGSEGRPGPRGSPVLAGSQVCSRAQANHAAVLFGVSVHSSCRPRGLSALRYVIISGLVGGR